MNLFKWIKDRFLERSSKLWISQVLGLLVLINVIPVETKTNIEGAIGHGQEVYEEVADSVASAIDLGKEKIEEGRQIAERAKDTGLRLRDILAGLWVVIISALGIGSKDAKKGVEYEARESLLAQALTTHGLDPGAVLPDLKVPAEFG